MYTQESVSEVWDSVAPVLERVIGQQPRYTLDYIRGECVKGDMQLWKCGNSAYVSEVIVFPRAKVARMVLGAGELKDCRAALEPFCDWARDRGCDEVEFMGRDPWLRVLGMEKIGVIGRRKLWD